MSDSSTPSPSSADPTVKATPKTIMRTMGVKGLTLYHLKSHLQKFRQGRQLCKESTENSKDGIIIHLTLPPFRSYSFLYYGKCFLCCGESRHRFIFNVILKIGCPGTERVRLRVFISHFNLVYEHSPCFPFSSKSYQVTEALRAQMEVQRRLHEQLEVQRRLQLRIEAQGKYLQSVLEKACKAIEDQAVAFAGLEAAREELSELAIKVSNGSQVPFHTTKMTVPSLSELAVAIEHKKNCSAESSLTSSPVSAALMKKRHRGVFRNGESLVVGHETGWVMPSSTLG
ncbi:hypothetical protein HID58_028831 [Brassica napus]|uniref:MYB-CC type transcription factor LHEQLE-containing domain-containing protein n=1 Tax=Brassica napus TaxID=3708 RepID=A0ABQ8CBG7_BRANA|nr:hypothetical protein HID58_028831 [Brassica napus]